MRKVSPGMQAASSWQSQSSMPPQGRDDHISKISSKVEANFRRQRHDSLKQPLKIRKTMSIDVDLSKTNQTFKPK